MSKRTSQSFDKYAHYIMSVQSPETDVRFFRQVYKDTRGKLKSSLILREDFCGTYAVCCEWTKLDKNFIAHGVDLDPEPLSYGREHFQSQLNDDQLSRLHIHRKNVLSPSAPEADIIAACNFSYFIFKERTLLKKYFASCFKRLKRDGIMIVDCFGGGNTQEANEEETYFEDEHFSYFWDQDSFDPFTHEAVFHIHFKRNGEAKRLRQFTYDWRMWTLAELRDLFHEVGFKGVDLYWEGTDEDGDGNGIYRKVTKVTEECDAWVAYLVAKK